jgi:hypothetical protein
MISPFAARPSHALPLAILLADPAPSFALGLVKDGKPVATLVAVASPSTRSEPTTKRSRRKAVGRLEGDEATAV